MARTKAALITTIVVIGCLGLGLFLDQMGTLSGGSRQVTYEDWLTQGNHRTLVQHYEHYLARQNTAGILPTPALLSAARDWQKCKVTPFVIPPETLWPQIAPTLRIVATLRRQRIIEDFTVTSAYRDYALNTCAGGSPGSRHLQNNALDLRVADDDTNARFQALCRFWRQQGPRFRMGLGFYAGGQIHIDSQGYRTWGPDYSRKSSPCA